MLCSDSSLKLIVISSLQFMPQIVLKPSSKICVRWVNIFMVKIKVSENKITCHSAPYTWWTLYIDEPRSSIEADDKQTKKIILSYWTHTLQFWMKYHNDIILLSPINIMVILNRYTMCISMHTMPNCRAHDTVFVPWEALVAHLLLYIIWSIMYYMFVLYVEWLDLFACEFDKDNSMVEP